MLKELIRSFIFTILGFILLYYFQNPEGNREVVCSFLWNLRVIIIFISVVVCYIFYQKTSKHNIYSEISIQLLSAFIGVFLALRINDYYNNQQELKNYNILLESIYIEMGQNLSNMKKIENCINTPSCIPFQRLHNASLINTIQSPLLIKFCDTETIILLNVINNNILTNDNLLDSITVNPLLYNSGTIESFRENFEKLRPKIELLGKKINIQAPQLGITSQQMNELKSVGITFSTH